MSTGPSPPLAFPVHPIFLPEGINGAGHIVGLLLVIAEPGSLMLYSVGLLGLGLAWRQRDKAPWCRSAACTAKPPEEEEDIANAALYLASDESKYMTGAPLIIDGGFTAK